MADKKYLLSNGDIQFVPLEFENDFFKDLEKFNLTAQLITDEPGKLLGTSLSQNNQQQDTELLSEDGSLESLITSGKASPKQKIDYITNYTGKFLDPPTKEELPNGKIYTELELNKINNFLDLASKDDDGNFDRFRKNFKEWFKNSNYNTPRQVQKWIKTSSALMNELLVNISAFETKEDLEEFQKKSDENLAKTFSDVEEIKFKKTPGIIEGFEEKDVAKVFGGLYSHATNALVSYGSQMLGASIGGPLGAFGVIGVQMIGPTYYEFNKEKANRLYGKNNPNKFNLLFENEQDEIIEPITNGAIQMQFERFGFKGINNAIKSVPGLKKGFGKIIVAGTREGFTEWAQYGMETINTSRGQGKSLSTSVANGVKSMLTKEGLEMWIAGFVGGVTISGGGRAVTAALRSDENSERKFNDYVDALYDLKTKRQLTQDTDLQDAYDLQIKQVENNFKNFLETTNKLSEYLTDDQRSDLTNILDAKNDIENKKEKLKIKFDNNFINENQYNDGIYALEGYNQTLNETISSIKKQALKAESSRQAEKIRGKIKEFDLEGKVIEATSSEIENMNLKDSEGNDVSKKAAGNFGFIRQFKDGSFEIVLNKDKPALGTAAHEFMHAVLFKTLTGSKQTQNNLASALLDYTSTLKSEGDQNFVNKINSYKNSEALGEEVITVMSESIIDGGLKYNESFFVKIGDILRRFFAQRGKIDYKFDTGRDVYNFIKDFNNSIKTNKVNEAIIKVAKEGAKGKLVEGTKSKPATDTKQDVVLKDSRDAKPDVDNLAVDPNTKENYTQTEWDRVGAKRAIEQFKVKRKEFENQGYLDGLIAARYKIKDRPQSFVADVLGSKEFINMINRFNRGRRGVETGPNKENESLFGYIQGQLRFRADDVFKEAERGRVPKGTGTVEADARTTEGQPKVQLEDTDTQITKFEEQEIKLRDDKVKEDDVKSRENKSKLRVELGIKNIGKGKVFKAVETAINSADPITQAKKFINTYKESLSNILFPMMEKIFPDANTMIKYRMAILESIPIDTLKKWQKELPAKDKDGKDFGNIFVKNHGRKSNQDFLYDFMYGTNLTGKNPRKRKLLPDLRKLYEAGNVAKLDKKDAVKNPDGAEYYRKKAAGITIWERLPVNSTAWTSYINGNFIGKRQQAKVSGTKGNNRIKVLKESSIAIGKDATPENLTTEFIQDYIGRKKLEGKITVEQVKKEILESIDRPADLKFSVDPKVQAENFKTAANKKPNNIVSDRGVTNLEVVNKIQEYKSAKSGKIRSRKIVDFIRSSKLSKDIKKHMGGFLSTHPKYIPYFQDSMTGGYDNGLFGIKDIFYSVVGIKDTNIQRDLRREKYSKTGGLLDVNKMNKFKNNQSKHIASNKARIDFLEGLIKDMYTYVKANPESKPAMVMFFKDGSKHQNHVLRYLAPIVGAHVDANGKFIEIEIKEEHGYPQNQINTIILDLLLNDNSSIKSVDDLMKVIRSSYSQWGLADIYDQRINKAKLNNSMPEYFYNDIVPRIIKGEFNNLPQGILGPIIRYIESNVPLNSLYLFEVNQTITEYFGVNVKGASQIDLEYLAPIQNNLIKDILLGNITKAEAKQKMKDVVAVGHKNTVAENKTANNIIDAFNKQAETIKKQNKELQADLEKRGYTFKSSKDGSVKGQTPSQMIKIIEEDLKKRGYTFVSNRGMSTFDFDETLIIDGENFVVATDPKTGETINIVSGDWPIKGPDLAAAGYTFNFDDFVNVRGGLEGPLLQKMRNQIQKYGANNVFVLTARPQTADSAIHGWLKSKGIDIPMKNITGLGDSRGEAKAEWMLEKFTEGYNDMYFVDDALPNVEAVKKVLEQLDVKSKVVQAKIKFSATASQEFNTILEQVKGINRGRIYSRAEALKLGINKGRYDLLVPPSANDFKGLMYYFMGKGRQGDTHRAWFEKHLFKPFANGIRAWNTYKQNLQNEYEALKKKYPQVVKSFNNKVAGTVYTNDTAIRVYLWDKNGFDIPGLNLIEKQKLVNRVKNNPSLQHFADTLSVISRVKDGYVKPSDNWVLQTIASDLNNIVERVGRKQFLQEYLDNVKEIFNLDNLNKIEAVYGTRYREALEDILYRMENGTNRIQGSSRIVNGFTEWINASVGAIMFVNVRSALLQTISMVNFINWSDNNVFKAGLAFANQIQYWKDFAMLYNSDQLKQRRKGIRIDVSASELTKAFSEGGTTLLDKTNSLIRYLLEKGFTPTQIADSFAIAAGGATFYRNRFNTYKKQGLSDAQAKEKAMLDFQEIAEETQQSSREDLISQQQASPLGRFILAFQNVTMQMTRLTVKSVSDLVNRRRIPGLSQSRSDMTHISKIIYYGAVQNIIFGALQSALAFMMWGDEEEDEELIKNKKIRVANGVLDSFLRGTGIYGAMVSTLKNVVLQTKNQLEADYGKSDFSKVAIDAINLSPPIGSKVRKIVASAKTLAYNKGISKEIGFRIENPTLVAAATAIEALTNIPIGRLVNKANNLEEAITGNHKLWQRVAMVLGWDRWSLGVEDEELKQAKDDLKRRTQNKRRKGKTKITGSDLGFSTSKSSSKSKNKGKVSGKDLGFVKEVRCTAIKKSGGRCKNTTVNKNKRCYAHQ